MQTLQVVAVDVDGTVRLQAYEFENGHPKSQCLCHGPWGGTVSGGRDGFAMTWHTHTQDCNKVSVVTPLLDSNCPCGCHEEHPGHRGDVLFVKCDDNFEYVSAGPGDVACVKRLANDRLRAQIKRRHKSSCVLV